MTRLLPLLFVAGLVLELVSIIQVGSFLGLFVTLLLLLAGGLLGIGLIRSAGTNILASLRSPIQEPSLQKGAAGEALGRAVSGLFFLIPGFFSDIVGVMLLLPPVRRWMRSKLPIRTYSATPGAGRHAGTIIEEEAVEIVSDIDPPAPPPSQGRGSATL
jgi:UPF0716 protein FxsA